MEGGGAAAIVCRGFSYHIKRPQDVPEKGGKWCDIAIETAQLFENPVRRRKKRQKRSRFHIV